MWGYFTWMKEVGIFLSAQLLITVPVGNFKSFLISSNHLIIRQLSVLIIHALLVCMATTYIQTTPTIVSWLTFDDAIGRVLILLQADEAIVIFVMIAPVTVNIVKNVPI